MGTYYLPRNVKGEGRILFIFTTKSLIYSVSIMNMAMVGIAIVAIFALIGFIIGTVKMPELGKFEFSKKTGGENLDDIIKRAITFKARGRKVYIYKEEDKND